MVIVMCHSTHFCTCMMPLLDQIQDACRFFLYESGFALFVALLINIAVISVSGTVCFADNLSPEDAEKCSDLSLDSSSFLLKARR